MSSSPTDTSFLRGKWLVSALVIWGLVGISMAFPEWCWGMHWGAFVWPGWPVWGLSGAGIIAFGLLPENRLPNFRLPKSGGWIVPVLLALLSGLLFALFPIQSDPYGDAFHFSKFLETRPVAMSQEDWHNLLSFGIRPRDGERTVLSFFTLIATNLNLPYGTVIRGVAVLCGGLFAGIWSWWILNSSRVQGSRILLLLIGLSSPFLMHFFGHIEVYAPFLVLGTAWLIGMVEMRARGSRKGLWGLGVALLLLVKVHPVGLLLVPVWGLGMADHFRPNANWLSWRKAGLFVGIPVVVAGLVLYFFVLKDFQDERLMLAASEDGERLFLPLIPADPPLDRYSMFGVWHLWDFLNVLLLWGPALWFTGISSWWGSKPGAEAQKSIVLSGLPVLLFAGLLFVLQPLVGMPMDWDLFTLPAAWLLVGLALRPMGASSTRKTGMGLALCLLSLPVFLVNAQREPLSHRLEAVAKYSFRTFYNRSAHDLNAAIRLAEPEPEVFRARLQTAVQEVKPAALPGNDLEYATMLFYLGNHLLEVEEDPEVALPVLRESESFSRQIQLNDTRAALMKALAALGEFGEAYRYARMLAESSYPKREECARLSVLYALESEQWERAETHARNWKFKWGYDPVMDQVSRGLSSDSLKADLRYLF